MKVGKEDHTMSLIKKTVVIHPVLDSYIRRTWTTLIEQGKDANYSSALNFMLFVAVSEMLKEEGITKSIRKTIWDFSENTDSINNLQTTTMLNTFEQKLNESSFKKKPSQ
jgi:hypothetical protein